MTKKMTTNDKNYNQMTNDMKPYNLHSNQNLQIINTIMKW